MKVLDVYAGEYREELRFELVDTQGTPIETTGTSATLLVRLNDETVAIPLVIEGNTAIYILEEGRFPPGYYYAQVQIDYPGKRLLTEKFALRVLEGVGR